ncbi:MAG: peptidoglycan-binding domain-containing protein [Myxococcota bacterium]
MQDKDRPSDPHDEDSVDEALDAHWVSSPTRRARLESAIRYNDEQHYDATQIKRVQRVVGAKPDGAWGLRTVDAVSIWQRQHQLGADGKVGPQTLAALERAASIRPEDRPKIATVGAWTGQASFPRIAKDVQFCVDHGLNRLDVVVNDFSKRRGPAPFDTYRPSKIVELCQVARDRGLEVHLMSWIMPHATFIEQAAEQLIPLCEQTGASSLQWDAEEPWTKAMDALPYEEAADRIARAFADLPCPMGVNGIGFVPAKRFRPLAEICDYLLPQCYATAGSRARPQTVVSLCVDRWRERFGRDKRLVIGLAAYRQEGIEGLTPQQAMNSSLDNVRAYGLDTVVYWSLRQIRESPEVAAAVAAIREPAEGSA